MCRPQETNVNLTVPVCIIVSCATPQGGSDAETCWVTHLQKCFQNISYDACVECRLYLMDSELFVLIRNLIIIFSFEGNYWNFKLTNSSVVVNNELFILDKWVTNKNKMAYLCLCSSPYTIRIYV